MFVVLLTTPKPYIQIYKDIVPKPKDDKTRHNNNVRILKVHTAPHDNPTLRRRRSPQEQ